MRVSVPYEVNHLDGAAEVFDRCTADVLQDGPLAAGTENAGALIKTASSKRDERLTGEVPDGLP
jgi:hypothetical protein